MFSLNSLDLGLRFIVAFLCEIYIKLVISKHTVLLLLNIKYAQEFPMPQIMSPRFMLNSPEHGPGCIVQSVKCLTTLGSYMLEMYLNIQECLEKSLVIKFALKST